MKQNKSGGDLENQIKKMPEIRLRCLENHLYTAMYNLTNIKQYLDDGDLDAIMLKIALIYNMVGAEIDERRKK